MSWRRFTRKLRRLVRPPRSAHDVVPNYHDYLRLQRETFLSFESEVPRWKEGQRRFVDRTMDDRARHARVLDCAAGDGAGLRALRELGFSRIIGVELSREKARRARGDGFAVVVCAMHDLRCFPDATFDVVLSSHTIEHAYQPDIVVDELYRVLTPEGHLHIVLPYPDSSHRNELAHVGKFKLGTDQDDNGASVQRFFTGRGFSLLKSELDDAREPEIWLHLKKTTKPQS